jgi:hypothetical protein
LTRLLTAFGFALAAVAALPAAGATNPPTGRIAFSLASGSLPNTGIPNADIYAVNADGSGLVRLTDDPVADFRSVVVARRTTDRVPPQGPEVGPDLCDERGRVAAAESDQASRLGLLASLVVRRQENRVRLGSSREGDDLGHAAGRLGPQAAEPGVRRVPGLVARR